MACFLLNSLPQLPAVVLPEDIRPYPIAESVHSLAVKRRFKAKSATLITGSLFKSQLVGQQKAECATERQIKNMDATGKKLSLIQN